MFSFPELLLSQSTASVEPAKITYETLGEDGKKITYVTFLTGTTDYVLTSISIGSFSDEMKGMFQILG